MTITPLVAVITPYFDEPIDYLRKCHQSVRQQTLPCTHIFVSDGKPCAEIDHWPVHHIKLPTSHADIGSTPRLIGSFHAVGSGYNYLSFLDADNWYSSDHLSTLYATHLATGASFVSCGRTLVDITGSILGPCPITSPDSFIDTSCMFLHRSIFNLLHNWVLMPDYGHLIGDRIFYHYIKQSGCLMSHSHNNSVFYRCTKVGLYDLIGVKPPDSISARPDYEASFMRWERDGFPPLPR